MSTYTHSVWYISGDNEDRKEPDKPLGVAKTFNLQSQPFFPLQAAQLAAKFKFFANAKFMCLTGGSDKTGVER